MKVAKERHGIVNRLSRPQLKWQKVHLETLTEIYEAWAGETSNRPPTQLALTLIDLEFGLKFAHPRLETLVLVLPSHEVALAPVLSHFERIRADKRWTPQKLANEWNCWIKLLLKNVFKHPWSQWWRFKILIFKLNCFQISQEVNHGKIPMRKGWSMSAKFMSKWCAQNLFFSRFFEGAIFCCIFRGDYLMMWRTRQNDDISG